MLFLLSFSQVMKAQRVAVSTNAGDWLWFGTANLNASVALGRRVSLEVGGKYNPWTFSKGDPERQFQQRQRSASLGVRVWPWHVYSGWWIDGRAKWQEFNRTALNSRQTTEGTGYGGSLSAGYSIMAGKHVNFEFGLGLWGGRQDYVVYACPSCGRIVDEGSRFFVLPNEIVASFVYVF